MMWMVLSCLILSYVFQHYEISVIWNAQIIPMALVYMTIGYVCKGQIFGTDKDYMMSKLSYVFKLLVVVAFIIPFLFPQVEIDMKMTKFGVPFLSLLVSITISLGLMLLSQILGRRKSIMTAGLVYLGRASLVIMFLHQFVNHVMIVARELHQL